MKSEEKKSEEKKTWETDTLTQKVIACVINVHQELGPGYDEKLYQRAMIIELREQKLAFEVEKEFKVQYKGHEIGRHRLDFLVEKKLPVELKSVEELGKVHYAHVRAYLKSAKLPTGILVNFNKERADFRRIER